jgi:SAM-dependent methyltransferase
MPDQPSVHGNAARKTIPLADQADTLHGILHGDTVYPAGSHVLDAGCGAGTQTLALARNNPGVHFTAIDISQPAIDAAVAQAKREKLKNVTFQLADIFSLPYKAETFDHVFVCFVLEHVKQPVEALLRLKKVLKKEGTLSVIEGDHGSIIFYPESRAALQAIQCLIHVQARLGGNSFIGRQLYPLLRNSGFKEPAVSPRTVYVDASRPQLVEEFIRHTFLAMMEGIREQALGMNLINDERWEQGMSDLQATTAADGVFCYTFFKGVAVKL